MKKYYLRGYLLIFFILCNSEIYGFQKKDSLQKGILKVLTWNIQDLGKSKSNEEIYTIAKIINDFDIVAIQEVVAKDPGGAKAVAKIADELNRMGNKWNYQISPPTKSPSNYIRERYAYLWKTSKLKIIKKATLDTSLENVIEREPFLGEFEIAKNKEKLHFINIHARVYNRNPEMEIAYFKYYFKKLGTANFIILGDFNLNENHTVWNPLYKLGFTAAIKKTPTSLKRKCKYGIYTNYPIDNIYFNTKFLKKVNANAIDFVGDCSNLLNSRKISDHLPVFLEFEYQ